MAEESVLSAITDKFSTALGGATRASLGMAGALLNGQQNISAYAESLSEFTDRLGPAGGALSSVIKGLTSYAEQSLAEYQALTQVGATFGKELVDLKLTAAELGLSVEEMTSFIKQNSRSLRAFGGTTEQAIRNFRQLSNTVLDSAELGTQLRKLGYTTSDINEGLALYGEISNANSRRDRMTVEQQAQAAKGLMVELDGLAKLTGKQRDQLADEMREKRRQGDINAFLMNKSAEQQNAFMTQYGMIANTLGQTAADTFADIALRGAPTTATTQGAYLAMGEGAQAAMMQAANQFKSGNIEQFDAAVNNMIGSAVDYQKTSEFQQAAILGGVNDITGAYADASAGAYDITNALDSTAGANESAADTLNRLQSEISEEQLHQMQTVTGIFDETISMQEDLRTLTRSTIETVIPRMEDAAMAAIQKFRDAMPSSQEVAQKLGGAVEDIFNLAASIDRGEPGNGFDMNAFQEFFSNLGGSTGTDIENQTDALGESFVGGTESINGNITETAGTLGESVVGSTESINGNITETAGTLGEQVTASEQNLIGIQEEFNTNREAAEAELTAAQSELQSAIDTGVVPEIVRAQERVDLAQQNLESTIAQGDSQILDAMSALNRATAMMANPSLPTNASGGTDWRFVPRRADGGKIPSGETALVGESGAEFVRGPAEVFNAKESMNMLGNLTKSIKAMQTQIETVQTSASTEQNGLSTNNTVFASLDKKFDTMINVLNQLVSVETDAVDTQRRTYKATRGLSGNMIRGI